jgi:Protein adenylyltransferase SelO
MIVNLLRQFAGTRVLRDIRHLCMSSRMSESFDYVCHNLTDGLRLTSEAKQMGSVTLETLHFDNLALRDLPIDPVVDITQRQVRGACFSRVLPTPVKNPRTVVFSKSAMALLGLPESELLRPEFAEYFSGNRILPGSEPAAHCYCGHQFGNFAGQLGDGATM